MKLSMACMALANKVINMMTTTKRAFRETIIDNPAAYAAATQARIIANANKTFYRTYPDYAEIEAFLSLGFDVDEYERKTYKDGFVGSVASAYHTYGKLTEKQVAAVRKCIIQRDARKAEWADKQAALDASREYVGIIGDKIVLTLVLKKVINIDTNFGPIGIFIFEDANKNVIIYKGGCDAVWNLAEGETVTLKATVKEHGTRNGVKQTLIQRPKAV